MEILTTKLNDGRIVLANRGKYGVVAKTFVNITQATKACEVMQALGCDVFVSGRRPYFVMFQTMIVDETNAKMNESHVLTR